MRHLRYFLLSLLTLVSVVFALASHYYYKGFYKTQASHLNSINYLDEEEVAKINQKAIELKKFALAKRFSKKYIFLADMSLPSGKNRFFVYDISRDSIIKTSLVAHGSGDHGFSLTPKFSNKKESGCTALGKYRIGKNYEGRFGTAYKLYGLDSTNSNAFIRNIVLHSYNCVPEQETYPYPICNSRGCPMVAPAFLKQLQTIIDKSKQPILLWIFN
jgi:L,D-transpeptidase-like protein